MARTVLVKTTAPGGYAAAGVAVTMAAADVGNGNRFVATGKELLVARNSGAVDRTVTIDSAPDPYGREGDISAETIAAGAIRVWGPFPLTGWRQSDGYVYVDGSNAEVLFGVIVVP